MISIESMVKMMEKKFHVSYEKIGQYVWEGFGRWIAMSSMKNTWNRNWLKAYQNNLVDYYAIYGERRS